MRFSVAFVLTALPFLVAASPVTRAPKGISIPITKRDGLVTSVVADITRLRAQLARLQG